MEDDSKSGQATKDASRPFAGRARRVSYNLRAQIEDFVTAFVDEKGIQEVMKLIEVGEGTNPELVVICTQILSAVLGYRCGIEAITPKAKKYLEKFFHLSGLNEHTKKQCIRIFFNIAKSSMPDQFDLIDKAAVSYAKESKTIAFQSLIQGFGYDDPTVCMALLKFINEMIF